MAWGLDLLAEIGVTQVEPAFIRGYVDFDETDFEPLRAGRLAREMDTRGLRVQALSAHMDLSGTDAPDALARRIDCAAQIGARFLITNAGRNPPGRRSSAVFRGRCQSRRGGVLLALENPGHGDGDLIGTPDAACAFIDDIDSDLVRLNVDVCNFATYQGGADPLPGLQKTRTRAAHIHLKDYRVQGADWHFATLGDGCLDQSAIVDAAGESPLGLELPLRLSRPGRADPVRGPRLSRPAIRAAIERSLKCCVQALAHSRSGDR